MSFLDLCLLIRMFFSYYFVPRRNLLGRNRICFSGAAVHQSPNIFDYPYRCREKRLEPASQREKIRSTCWIELVSRRNFSGNPVSRFPHCAIFDRALPKCNQPGTLQCDSLEERSRSLPLRKRSIRDPGRAQAERSARIPTRLIRRLRRQGVWAQRFFHRPFRIPARNRNPIPWRMIAALTRDADRRHRSCTINGRIAKGNATAGGVVQKCGGEFSPVSPRPRRGCFRRYGSARRRPSGRRRDAAEFRTSTRASPG